MHVDTAAQQTESKLNHKPEVEDELLKDLFSWLDENPHINAKGEPLNLLYFLRGCKYDLEKTKKKIKSFYQMRAERDEWFLNRDPFLPEIQELLEIGVFLPLKEKADNNRQVFIIRTAAHDPKTHSQNNVFKTGKMLLDLVLKTDESISINGLVAVFDMKDVTLAHALQLPPALIKKSVDCWKSYPCMIKHLEFINAPFHVNMVLNTFRLFMTSKMRSRVCVRRGTSKLGTILPKDLGGSSESYTELAKYWKHMAEENVSFFVEDEKYKTDLAVV